MAGVYFFQTYVLYCCRGFGYCMYYLGNRTYEVSTMGGLMVTQIIWFSRVNRLTYINQFSSNLLGRRHWLESHERSSETDTWRSLIQYTCEGGFGLAGLTGSSGRTGFVELPGLTGLSEWYRLPKLVSLSKDVFEQACQPEVDFLHHWAVVLPKFSEQIISIRKNTLTNKKRQGILPVKRKKRHFQLTSVAHKIDCSQSPILPWDRRDIARLTMNSGRFDFQMYRGGGCRM